MKLGVTCFITDTSIGPVELAREVEARGFHAIYVPEHTHIPVSRATPAPASDDGVLPDYYWHLYDPFVALSAVAAATSLHVGTGICLVAQHDPIVLAKTVASLDSLSGGRFTFGVGFGWNREEMEDHGVDFRRRREQVRDHMAAMQALWSTEESAHDGEFVRFDAAWSWPKPVQQPRPRTLIGGAPGPKLFSHVAEWADGWMPIGGRGVAAALPDLAKAYESAGRDPATLQVVPFGTIPNEGKLERYASLGIDEVVLQLPSGPRDDVLPVLDRYMQFL